MTRFVASNYRRPRERAVTSPRDRQAVVLFVLVLALVLVLLFRASVTLPATSRLLIFNSLSSIELIFRNGSIHLLPMLHPETNCEEIRRIRRDLASGALNCRAASSSISTCRRQTVASE